MRIAKLMTTKTAVACQKVRAFNAHSRYTAEPQMRKDNSLHPPVAAGQTYLALAALG